MRCPFCDEWNHETQDACSNCGSDLATVRETQKLKAEIDRLTSERDDCQRGINYLSRQIEELKAERDNIQCTLRFEREARQLREQTLKAERDDYRKSNEFLNNEVGKLTKEIEDCLLQLEGANVAAKLFRAEVEAAFRYGYRIGVGDYGENEVDEAWADYQRERGTR